MGDVRGRTLVVAEGALSRVRPRSWPVLPCQVCLLRAGSGVAQVVESYGGDRTGVPPERSLSFDELFENSSDPAFILDPVEDRILAVNQAGCAMLGYTHDELLATAVSQIHPAELPQLSAFLDSVLETGEGSTITLTCRTKSGDFLPADMALHAFETGGRVRILGLVHDRSEHRQRDAGG
jgi:PAS domain S-box-containing protein